MGIAHVTIRDATEADLPAIAKIYGHWVLHGLASFELDEPDVPEIARRYAAILADKYPYLVAEAGQVLGYAYAGPYRSRLAYRFTCENSIYMAPDMVGCGVGGLLLAALIQRCEAAGLRLMVAVIGDRENAASVQLHARHGFQMIGILPAIGWKKERWVDSVLMARSLGDGSITPPVER